MTTADAIADLRLGSDRRLAMAAFALIALPSMFFVRNDFAMYADNWTWLSARLSARLVLVATPILGIIALRSVRSRADYSRIVFRVALVITAAYLALTVLRPLITSVPFRVRPFAIGVMYFVMPNTLARQILPPLLLSVGLGVVEEFRPGILGTDVTGDFVILAVVNAAGILVVRRRIQLEEDVDRAWHQQREARLAAQRAVTELRTLRGIVPICSHCKNVRTALGDWQAVEEYVRDHSSADFSHGICPDCLDELYVEQTGTG